MVDAVSESRRWARQPRDRGSGVLRAGGLRAGAGDRSLPGAWSHRHHRHRHHPIPPDLSTATPNGTVTILFTDIEGSTQLTEQLGDDDWLTVLREHNEIVRSQVIEYSGFEVKSQGDGFMLAFPSAKDALRCAIGIQRPGGQRIERDRSACADRAPHGGAGSRCRRLLWEGRDPGRPHCVGSPRLRDPRLLPGSGAHRELRRIRLRGSDRRRAEGSFRDPSGVRCPLARRMTARTTVRPLWVMPRATIDR